jgi:hypothetical protein
MVSEPLIEHVDGKPQIYVARYRGDVLGEITFTPTIKVVYQQGYRPSVVVDERLAWRMARDQFGHPNTKKGVFTLARVGKVQCPEGLYNPKVEVLS